MSKMLSAVLILSSITVSGCSLLRVAGPCYGVGCPVGTEGRDGQYKQGEGPKTLNAAAPAKSVSAPTQSANVSAKPAAASSPAAPSTAPQAPSEQAASAQAIAPQVDNAQANLSPVTPAPVATAQAATAQAAPASASTPETKPSPFHAIGDFFAHLIPHHNTAAKSGAAD